MARRLRCAWLARATVAAAVCALPLIATGSAQAAIAGANPYSSPTVPVMTSATIVTPTDVHVCFDKALSSQYLTSSGWEANPALGVLGGYRSANYAKAVSVTIDNSNPNCVYASFNLATSNDINQYTIFTLAAGAVEAQSTGALNVDDSTPLIGSSTHNGTTGLTTAPNLTGVVVGSTSTCTSGAGTTCSGSITYSFDKATNLVVNPITGDFWYEDAAGNVCNASTAAGTTVVTNSPTAFTVQVFFGTTCNGSAATPLNARRAGVFQGGVWASSDCPTSTAGDNCSYNPLESVLVPNAVNGGATNLPDLTGAKLETNYDKVDFTFDQLINSAAVDPSDFTVFLSDGSFDVGSSAVIGAGGNTVDVTFPNLFNHAEYAVVAAVNGTAVANESGTSVTESTCGNSCRATNDAFSDVFTNSPGSAPIGDNAGAFARGFTTGPDAYAVTFNPTNGVVDLFFDQRVFGFTCSEIKLLAANGTTVANACSPAIVSIPSGGQFPSPGPEEIGITFPPSDLSTATAVQLDCGSSSSGDPPFGGPWADTDCAFYTDRDTVGTYSSVLGDEWSVDQVLQPVGSAARLKGYAARKHGRKHHRRHGRKHHHKRR
jgi:hypothetical protein